MAKKLTVRLIWYSHVLHEVISPPRDEHDAAGNVSCRVRTYFHDEGQPIVEGKTQAIKEESHVFTDAALTERAMKHGAANWNEADLKAALAEKLGDEVV